jgi:hypothetical protein
MRQLRCALERSRPILGGDLPILRNRKPRRRNARGNQGTGGPDKQASHEADAIAAANEEKAEELMQRFLAELGNFEQGDSRAADRALCAYEGYLRLQFAPTLHMYAAMGHDHPAAAEGMRSIDEAVATALRSVVENHGLPTPTDK